MNDSIDATYYLSRARQAEEAAQKTLNPIAADIHRTLASRYREKASEFEDCQKVSTARD